MNLTPLILTLREPTMTFSANQHLCLMMLATAMLAGCTSPDGPGPDPSQTFLFACPESIPAGVSCEIGESGRIIVSGTFQPTEDRQNLGVWVPGGGLTIHDFTAVGAGLDIAVPGGCNCSIAIENVTLEGPGSGIGLSIRTASGASGGTEHVVKLQNVTAQGYPFAINLTAARVQVADAVIACDVSGIRSLARWVQIDNASVSGCLQHGLELHQSVDIVARSLHVTNNSLGLLVSSANQPSQLSVVDSTFDSNGLAVHTRAPSNAFSCTTWTNNGQPSAWLEAQEHTPGALSIAQGRAEVHESYFSSNHYLAVNTLLATVDATNNWWGDPLGPRIGVYGMDTPGAVGGDAVAPPVEFYPFHDSASSVSCR